ncbi:N-acyl homoserine lactonase family protein [Acrocarpospora macrocephala]|uniref:MBL fold metallo-hydrolase n=1 Tax=Acrocarpospora macrocephala TaxID=150177 RepID=A0A5M3XB76_9ACTN|nr:N-acyl homoserine lactonase family protein [Acrocarpospora macrocephala]GES15288.1 MBL fold metallo-hydrolase [Acrocarpospora macrocephala]
MSSGIRVYPLSLGELTNDAGLPFYLGGLAMPSDPEHAAAMCTQCMSAYVIEHPKAGPILFDTGVAPEREGLWPKESIELASPSLYEPEHRLDNALNAAGFELSDIKAVVISHLHMDHGGGLEFFRGTNVPVFVHETELKNAFYNVATGEDFGPYLPHYIDPTFNWVPIHGDKWDLFHGITLYQMSGHAHGLLVLRAELRNHGHWIFASDQFPLRRNYEEPIPQGWIMRDHPGWWRSWRFTKSLEQRFDARIVFGHDKDEFAKICSQRVYD